MPFSCMYWVYNVTLWLGGGFLSYASWFALFWATIVVVVVVVKVHPCTQEVWGNAGTAAQGAHCHVPKNDARESR